MESIIMIKISSQYNIYNKKNFFLKYTYKNYNSNHNDIINNIYIYIFS